MRTGTFTLTYSSEVLDHMKAIERKYWPLIKRTIEEQLVHHPDTETTNRKPLSKPPIDNRWELRLGPPNKIRVFYQIDREINEVLILAIGIKEKERLHIGKKVVKL
jgi:mRNA-degrading endonuclease RelE of RelBE toxin-antitoxin system